MLAYFAGVCCIKKVWNIFLPLGLIITSVAALAVVLYVSLNAGHTDRLFGGKVALYAGDWHTAAGESVDFSDTLPVDANGNAVIITTLPQPLPEGSVIVLKTNYQAVEAFAGGENVFTWEQDKRDVLQSSFGLSCYIINIPSSAGGQLLELRLSPFQAGGGSRVYSVMLGDGIAAALSIVEQELDTVILFFILVVLLILITGLFVVFRYKVTGEKALTDILYLTLFIAISAVWLLTDSDITILFTRNGPAARYISFFTFMLLPVPLLFYVKNLCRAGRKALDVLAALFLFNFIVCLGLHLLRLLDLAQTIITCHVLIIATCIILIYICTADFIKHRRRDIIDVQIGLGLLCAVGIIAVTLNYTGRNPDSAPFFSYGLTGFILALGLGAMIRLITQLVKSRSFEKLTSAIPSGICRIENFDTCKIRYANGFYYRMFGYTESESEKAGFTSADFTVLPDDLLRLKEQRKRCLEEQRSIFETEARHIHMDGRMIWILARYQVNYDNGGEITAVMIDITDRKVMEEQLRIREEEYRIATQHSDKTILRYDMSSRTIYRHPGVKNQFGAPLLMENVPEVLIEMGVIAQESEDVFCGFFDAICRGEREGSAVIGMRDMNSGLNGWYHYDFTTIFDDEGKPVQAIISYYDITLQREKEFAFQIMQQNRNMVPKSATVYFEYNLTSDMIEREEGEMQPEIPVNVRRTLKEMSEYTAAHFVCKDDRESFLEFYSRDRLLEAYSDGRHTDKLEYRRITADGQIRWTLTNIQLIPDPYTAEVKGYFVHEDIHEQKQEELTLHERSTMDSLTGLLNRRAFIEKMNTILRKSDHTTQHAMIMLDIDKFKKVNDTLGHSAGDTLLMKIAEKLKYALRSDDLCGRLGGDEFVICLKNINFGKPLETRLNDLCHLICDEGDWGISVSASFGIAGYPFDGTTFDELYKKADIALYKAKAQGRGGYAIYDPQLSLDDWVINEKSATIY
jgi:diguanylate cyclase (GGDEF)-like protein/PAS domain S-box-containing protein